MSLIIFFFIKITQKILFLFSKLNIHYICETLGYNNMLKLKKRYIFTWLSLNGITQQAAMKTNHIQHGREVYQKCKLLLTASQQQWWRAQHTLWIGIWEVDYDAVWTLKKYTQLDIERGRAFLWSPLVLTGKFINIKE